MRSVITDFVITLSGSIGLAVLSKATVILVLGLAVGALAGRAQASWRHLVFATTLAAVLALPLVAFAVPELPIAFVVDTQSADQRGAPIEAATSVAAATALPTAARTAPEETWSLPSVATILLFTWIGGVTALMISLAVDLMRVRHFRRCGLPSQQLRGIVDRLTSDSRLKRVDVLLHEDLQTPVAFGFFQPTIMLPVEVESWSEADLRRALVHELEHIRRGDWATQLAARTACAFYWFHPLIWMAWRKLCLEAERACDDAVVETAGNTEYAEQLVSLSRQLTGRDQAVLGMAKRSDLARRISSLLDTTRGRGRASFAAAAISVLIGATVVISIGPLHAVAQTVAPRPSQKEIATLDKRSNDDVDDDIEGNPLDVALFKAAERNALEKVRPLLEQGANVNAVLSGDGTPLIAAAREGHIEMVRLLLDSGAKPSLGVSGDGNPLQNAAQEGHRDVVTLLLERGADIDAGIEGDGNALIMASGAGHVEVVTLLLDRGADIHKVVAGDENPIIKACEQGQLEVVKLLVARGADINSHVRVEFGNGTKRVEEVRTPLSQARKGNHTAVVEYLLSAGARQ
jgi:beta-lactamase regulating signal transducer with metallopeptidase domain/ankyrin repeat protein